MRLSAKNSNLSQISFGARRMTLGKAHLALTIVAWCGASAQDLCLPHVEEHANWGSASFRPHRDAFLNCPVSEATFQRVLAEWLRSRGETAPAIKTIGLGRAISYPWISEYIAGAALTSPQWNPARGRSRTGSNNYNSLVAGILSNPAFIKRLQIPFEATPYFVVSVSVQKVLVGKVGDVMPGVARESLLVPYDAQLWIVLERTPRP